MFSDSKKRNLSILCISDLTVFLKGMPLLWSTLANQDQAILPYLYTVYAEWRPSSWPISVGLVLAPRVYKVALWTIAIPYSTNIQPNRNWWARKASDNDLETLGFECPLQEFDTSTD